MAADLSSLESDNNGNGGAPLLTGLVSAALASACCAGPLLLLTLGVSGAWIGKLTALEPYQPVFIGIAMAALFFAARRIWARAPACGADEVCAAPRMQRGYKLLFAIGVVMVVVAIALPFAAA